MSKFKKIILHIELRYLKLAARVSYKYYLRKFPYYLSKLGVKFTGDIKNTGFIASSTKFDSIDYAKYIELGEETIISADVLFLVHDYSIATALRTIKKVKKGALPHFIKGIIIGNNCFIGARSILLPGTKVGDNVIIGAGSIVKGIIPDNVVIAGNPAKILKSIKDYGEYHLAKNDFLGSVE